MNDLIPEESSEEVVVENLTVLLICDALASFKVWVRDLISIWPVWFQTLIKFSSCTNCCINCDELSYMNWLISMIWLAMWIDWVVHCFQF